MQNKIAKLEAKLKSQEELMKKMKTVLETIQVMLAVTTGPVLTKEEMSCGYDEIERVLLYYENHRKENSR